MKTDSFMFTQISFLELLVYRFATGSRRKIAMRDMGSDESTNQAPAGSADWCKQDSVEEDELRAYVREILDECMPHRFALGSGNTVANYIPVRNYLAMLDEARQWAG